MHLANVEHAKSTTYKKRENSGVTQQYAIDIQTRSLEHLQMKASDVKQLWLTENTYHKLQAKAEAQQLKAELRILQKILRAKMDK